MNPPREMEDWEAPMSDIRDWTYILIGVFGFENVKALRERALETPLNERDAMLLACEGEVLRSNIPIVPSHELPIHPFDTHRHLLSILNGMDYVPGEVPDDAPTLRTGEYIRWFLLTLLGKFRYDDRKAWEEQEVVWRSVQLQHDPHTEPDDWEDFMRSRRDEETRNRPASRDEITNNVYNNMSPVSPSGLAATMPNLPPQLHHWHEAFQAASPTLQPPFSILDARYPYGFAPSR
ncbi:uncharacterized protein EV420DRAFT_1653414 [Desarmillaria tabescens]|uniref:Uncharacterized protein n=1 Tax=Armillaria tabescens TaxID=1929756 RepID=A0AA39J4F1_ARMTA|nr:uncharacterized protein EV420DRAFT_1653414 [Desarmillaria tabescens]KAK0435117.1 hypothetical protein EV420DRAFT_1653414 [Desarmillaria tabescens]